MEKQNSTYWRIIRGELDSAEQLEQEILIENYTVETANFLREMLDLHIISNEFSGIHRFSSENALQKVQQQILDDSKRTSGGRKLYSPWMVAASIAVIIGLAGLHLYLFRPVSYHNSTDQPMAIVLSDFSEVVLAPQAKLEVSRYYGLIKRNLHLKGNAFFNVSSDPGKVFKVSTESCDITVLGTKFFVEESAKDEGLKVELKEGKLSLEAKDGTDHLLIDSGVVSIAHGKINSLDQAGTNAYKWLGAPLVFDDMPIVDIVERINAEYGYELISLETGEAVDCRLHTVVYPGMIEEFMNELQILFEIKIRKYKGTFVIDEINCNG